MILTPLLSCLTLLLFQQEEEVPPPPPKPSIPIEEALKLGKDAFIAGNYQEAVVVLADWARESNGEAMMLSADAFFALDTQQSRRRAIDLYERCIYENTQSPYPEHSFFQLAAIYMAESTRARDAGDWYLAREQAGEAEFYLRRLIKKHPNSFYHDQTLQMLFENSLTTGDYEKTRDYATQIWNSSIDPELLTRVEPILFIRQDKDQKTLADLDDTFRRHAPFIETVPELLLEYAVSFEELGDLAAASKMFVMIDNLWPGKKDAATSLRRLADLHRRQGEAKIAAFLYAQIIARHPNSLASSQAFLGAAELIESRGINTFYVPIYTPAETSMNGPLRIYSDLGEDVVHYSYRQLVEEIRRSPLDDAIRARYSYRQAQFEAAFGNLDTALDILRNLHGEYERGPFVGLYRSFYEKLLFQAVEDRYAAQQDWQLDSLYWKHQLLASTSKTRYPHLIAKAYLRLNLPSSALQVYEKMWAYKDSIRGFDLAFEEALTDYLMLLNQMRRDEKLAFRLDDYAATYSARDRFQDRYRYVRTIYESRQLMDEDEVDDEDALTYAKFLEAAAAEDFTIGNLWDARRLRRVALIAQEQGLEASQQDRDKKAKQYFALCDKLYQQASAWKDVKRLLPDLEREAVLYRADRFYSLGNYFEAEKRYRQILGDASFQDRDRDWSYLQIARLHELKGEMKQSLRIYGQIAYAEDEESKPWAIFAKQRLASIADEMTLEELEKTLGEK